jgi:exosome complex RNA-binding protein Rrp4
MGIKNFFLKQMLRSKLKGLPPAEQDRIVDLVEKNPEFFKKIGDEVQKRIKSGKSEMEATMQVMRENQAELQKLMQK